MVAAGQRISPKRRARRRTPLLVRLEQNRKVLQNSYDRLTAAADSGTGVGPAGEWLLDNFHVLQEHIGEVRESLPTGYYRELPVLANGPLAGYPRVYELAITLISHTEGRIGLDNVTGFVAAFQQVTPLTIGELWAIPAMLRLGLIESVRRMSLRSVQRLQEMEQADAAVARLIAARAQSEGTLDVELDWFVGDPPALTPTFISRFVQQLRQEAGGQPGLMRLEQWISEEAMTPQEATTRSTERMAITQVVMANSITSLRAVGRMEWRTFVERESRIEQVLRDDPSGFYAGMTFATRDRYRHSVERIAKRTRLTEEAVAQKAVECSRSGLAEYPGDQRRAHVGYYLVDQGLADLERLAKYSPAPRERVDRWVRRHPNVVFVGGILLATALALITVLWLGSAPARSAWPWVILVGFLPAADIAVSLMNQLVTAFLDPRPLPKLDLHEHGVPEEYRTAVVIPTLFPTVDSVEESLENLEVQFLANREAHLHFALLGDFTDSASETRPDDAAILQCAIDGINALNARYAQGREDAFYLFHRPRRWNPMEAVWMGWERKRGKLAEFNRFVLQGEESGFSAIVGDKSVLRSVRYVITLDADTTLPPDAAPLLVGALAHPLNRAVYDSKLGRVISGYGILQPRVGVSLPSAHRSIFAAIHSGHPGVDPYTTAVSDVYQDLYGEGSFTGKGVYDVAAFEQATAGRFPENTLLSHDLIEGNYARAGLATDVIVYDDYPTRYSTYTRRKHRWIRGDWQLLPWLRHRVPGPQGDEPNRLSILSRWKIVDNLRRSTVELAQLVFLVAGWTLFPGPPIRWTMLGLGTIAAPWIINLLLALVQPPLDKSWRAYYAAVGRDLGTSIQQISLALVFLPHQAWASADAIVRTLWRLGVSRRHLLQWQAAAQIERGTATSALAVWRQMFPALVIALATMAFVVWRIEARPVAPADQWQYVVGVLPLILAWLASPGIAKGLAAPVVSRGLLLAAEGRRQMHRYALLHWRFFDRFVNEQSHWLAPDNFQEDPKPVIALRTSPTNIGLQLLATVSARDLGFITLDEMSRRLELAFRSLERLRRLNGHFYNWYDLTDLKVLEPAYVSTVDSGNLAGHFVALRQACMEMIDEPLREERIGRGVDVALMLAEERRKQLIPNHPAGTHLRSALKVVAQFGRKTPAIATLHRVAEALRHYETELGSAGLGADKLEQLTEWSSWTLRLIETVEKSSVVSPQSSQSGIATDAARPRNDSVVQGGGIATGASHPRNDSLRELAKRSPAAAEVLGRLEVIAERAYQYAMEMDFRVLFDRDRKLFTIGFSATTHAPDPSYYDLLASEARLASYIAVAKNDAPVDHWFRLGRTLTYAAGKPALVSWSGSMFEYLMPMLVMRAFPSTMLAQTCRDALLRQVSYGSERGVPWGVSESAYNVRDRHHTYQYRPFGVPDLALKRGLGRELVVAPYASLLAAMIEPQRALSNLRELEKLGALGPYGFRESLDYTRPDPEMNYALVGAFFAHHIGMSLVAMTNVLANNAWQRRFHADPIVRSAELLLHERIPRRLVVQDAQKVRPDEAMPEADIERPAVREVDTPDTAHPHIALLGHVPYTIMVSHCGGGYSRYEDLAVSRWQSDGTRDFTGQFCYLKDLTSGRMWSAAHQPVCAPAAGFQALLATDRVTFHRIDGRIETSTEIAVVPEDSAEVRRITVTNNSDETREIELTSYGEIVLAPPESDRAHPAFGNLFVETEWHDWCSAISATRRARSSRERPLWCVHVVSGGPEQVGQVSWETDRAQFVGRGRTTRNPAALDDGASLSGSTGPVLDPIFALRTRIRLKRGRSASVAFTTFVAGSREGAFELADRYRDPHSAQRALDLAWTSSQVELREFNLTPGDAAVFQELGAILLYGSPALRAPQSELKKNHGSQQVLWSMGVSGDWPILLATIDSEEGLPTLRQVIQAHHYWRRRGMMVDLVVLNTHPPSYIQDMADKINGVVFSASDTAFLDQPGGVFVRRQDVLNPEQLRMLRATARVHVSCQGQALSRVLATAMPDETLDEELEDISPALRAPARSDTRMSRAVRKIGAALPALLTPLGTPADRKSGGHDRRSVPRLTQDNGIGGLTEHGDYLIRLSENQVPPAPWSNIIANRHGGFMVTERGGGCTWAENSYFFRLTPWHNDPVSDPVSEVIYLQDEATGDLWCPTPGPIPAGDAFTVRHAPGTSSFTGRHDDIESRLKLGLAPDSAVKLSLLRLTNRGDTVRRIRLTTYMEWTLGVLREHTQHQVHTRFDREREALLATNYFDPSFAGWTGFHVISEPVTAYTAGRRDFIGRNRSVADPAALLAGGNLSGITGAGIDPCAALQCTIELAPGDSREISIALGAAASESVAYQLAAQYRDLAKVRTAIDETVAGWGERLSVIQVKTPEPTFDAMVNRWTLYQALSCRMWGRSAMYQSSGAYGFRDQLQDVLAFVYAEPGLAREHIVRAAGRQFVEGDVQHWWHPHSGRGVRTKFSDDLAWLPYVVDQYVRVTGDASVLDESAPFLKMRPLAPEEHEIYDLPEVAAELGSVYQHCIRALRRACTTGEHGLPLIGIGDWNDGMNRVGIGGKGESVWLAWFLAATLRAFAEHAESRGDETIAGDFRRQADLYLVAVEQHGWDGEWYRRAYFDDGTPLGSRQNQECRIDSIAQSWAVISGADGQRGSGAASR